MSVAFSPDGKMLASGVWYGTVRLWDVASGKEIRQLQGHNRAVFSLVFSPDGKMLASAGHDGTVRLWDVASGKEVHQLQGHPERDTNVVPELAEAMARKYEVYAVVFSPDGKMLASAGHDGTLRLWEVCTGKEIRKLEGPQETLYGLAMSPDGKTVASAGNDKTVLIWLLAELWAGSSISAGKLDPKQLESLWADLAGQDTSKAYQAVGTLIAGARDSVPFLQEQMCPVKPVDGQQFPVSDGCPGPVPPFCKGHRDLSRQGSIGGEWVKALQQRRTLIDSWPGGCVRTANVTPGQHSAADSFSQPCSITTSPARPEPDAQCHESGSSTVPPWR